MMNELLDAIVSEIKSSIPAVKTVDKYDGELTEHLLEDLVGKGTPAVHVAMVGATDLQTSQQGQVLAPVGIMAFVLTRHYRGIEPAKAALDLCEHISSLALNYTWGLTTGVSPAEKLRIDNLFSGDVDNEGLALYSVGWTQPVRWGKNLNETLNSYDELEPEDHEYTWEDFTNTTAWYAQDQQPERQVEVTSG